MFRDRHTDECLSCGTGIECRSARPPEAPPRPRRGGVGMGTGGRSGVGLPPPPPRACGRESLLCFGQPPCPTTTPHPVPPLRCATPAGNRARARRHTADRWSGNPPSGDVRCAGHGAQAHASTRQASAVVPSAPCGSAVTIKSAAYPRRTRCRGDTVSRPSGTAGAVAQIPHPCKGHGGVSSAARGPSQSSHKTMPNGNPQTSAPTAPKSAKKSQQIGDTIQRIKRAPPPPQLSHQVSQNPTNPNKAAEQIGEVGRSRPPNWGGGGSVLRTPGLWCGPTGISGALMTGAAARPTVPALLLDAAGERSLA